MKNCPKCNLPLTLGAYEGNRVLRCDTCHGYLVGLSELAFIKRVTGKSQEELTAEVNAEFQGNTTNPVACPRCRVRMTK